MAMRVAYDIAVAHRTFKKNQIAPRNARNVTSQFGSHTRGLNLHRHAASAEACAVEELRRVSLGVAVGGVARACR